MLQILNEKKGKKEKTKFRNKKGEKSMNLQVETVSSSLESVQHLSFSEIYMRGIPLALIYATLQLYAIGALPCKVSSFIILMAAVEWPIILPIYLYGIYTQKIKKLIQ